MSAALGALPLPYPFELPFMQNALIAGLAVGVAAPLIGVFLVQRRMSLFGDGIGHLAFAGVGGGLLLGIWPVWAAMAVAGLGAIGIERLRARGRVSGDLALALFFYAGLAVGVVLIGKAGALNATVISYLFGSILTVTPDETAVVVALAVALTVIVAVLRRVLFAVVVDEEWARVAGLPVGSMSMLLAVLTAVAIVAAMPAVGILLVAAMMVLPVASGQLLGHSFRATLWWSVGVGEVSVVGGLAASRQWELVPSGTIVLVAAVIFAVVFAFTRSRTRSSVLTTESST